MNPWIRDILGDVFRDTNTGTAPSLFSLFVMLLSNGKIMA